MAHKQQIIEFNEVFKLHEMVFVRMRGYKALWPSRIISMSDTKVQVFFLGCMGQV